MILHLKREKEKNTAVVVSNKKLNQTNMDNIVLIPNKSVGPFVIGDSIDKYLSYPHIYERRQAIPTYSYDSYTFDDYKVTVWTKNNIIETVRCDEECFWEGQNLIKMPFDEFLERYQLKPDNSESIYLSVYGRGQNQMVYDFDDVGLQVWVWRKRIVTVLVSDNSLDLIDDTD